MTGGDEVGLWGPDPSGLAELRELQIKRTEREIARHRATLAHHVAAGAAMNALGRLRPEARRRQAWFVCRCQSGCRLVEFYSRRIEGSELTLVIARTTRTERARFLEWPGAPREDPLPISCRHGDGEFPVAKPIIDISPTKPMTRRILDLLDPASPNAGPGVSWYVTAHG